MTPRPVHSDYRPTPLDDSGAELSRDGRWLAYNSGDALYVSPFPAMSARTLIARGGSEARWSSRELFFIQDGQLMAANFTAPNGAFEFEAPRRLFEAPVVPPWVRYDSTADGQRFILLLPLQQRPGGEEIRVRLNGFDELRAR